MANARHVSPAGLGAGRKQRYLSLFAVPGIFLMSSPFGLQFEQVSPQRPIGFYLEIAITLLSITVASDVDRLLAAVKKAFPAFLLPLFFMLSSFWSTDPYLSVRLGFRMAIIVLFCCAIVSSGNSRGLLLKMLLGLFLTLSISLLWVQLFPDYAIHQQNDLVQDGHTGEWRGVFQHKNIFAQLCGISLALIVTEGHRAVGKTLTIILAMVGFLDLYFTGGVSGLIVFVTTTLFALVLRLPRSVSRLIIAGTSIAIAFAGMLDGRIIQGLILPVLGKSEDLSGRTFLWDTAFGLISRHPLIGYSASAYSSPEIRGAFERTRNVSDPHNALLMIVIAGGLVGMVLVMGVIVFAVSKGVAAAGERDGGRAVNWQLALLFGWLIAGLVESGPMMAGNPLYLYGTMVQVSLLNLMRPGTTKLTRKAGALREAGGGAGRVRARLAMR